MARRRFQSGCLFKRGKRRKVWVGRWRETVMLDNRDLGQLRRSAVLGSVAELPKRGDAQMRLDERLRPINMGAGRPEAFMEFGTFVETQWKTLVLPNFKRSTQHGYKTVLNVHLLPTWRGWRLRDIERLAVQQWVAEKFRQQCGWQSVRNAWVLLSSILETAVEFGFLTVNPARGVKFPQKELKEKPAIIAGDSFGQLLKQVDEPYRTMVGLIAATAGTTHLRWRFANAEPEPDFKYRSNATARRSSANSTTTSSRQGRLVAVCRQRPSL